MCQQSDTHLQEQTVINALQLRHEQRVHELRQQYAELLAQPTDELLLMREALNNVLEVRKITDPKEPGVTVENHIDDWIDDYSVEHPYAQWFFWLHRLPARLIYLFDNWISKYPLYCTWNNRRWRVTGASSLGDVWLQKELTWSSGYSERVDVTECSEWSDQPNKISPSAENSWDE